MKCEITGKEITGKPLNKFRVIPKPKIDWTPVLILDFDGVICDGEFIDEKTIIGNPVITNLSCDSIVYMRKMRKEKIPMVIFSCRNTSPNGVKTMKSWLISHGLEEEIVHNVGFPTYKPYGVYIDDNCVQALKYGVYFPTVEEVKNWLEKKKKC